MTRTTVDTSTMTMHVPSRLRRRYTSPAVQQHPPHGTQRGETAPRLYRPICSAAHVHHLPSPHRTWALMCTHILVYVLYCNHIHCPRPETGRMREGMPVFSREPNAEWYFLIH